MTTTALDPTTLARVLNRAGLHHLSISSLQVLCALAAFNSASMTSLARQLEVTAGAMTGIADVLEGMDLIYRQPSRTDRRKTWLILTPAGHLALQDILNA